FQQRPLPSRGANFSVPPIQGQEQDFTVGRKAKLLALRPRAGIMTNRAGGNTLPAQRLNQAERAQGSAARGAVEHVEHLARSSGRYGQGTCATAIDTRVPD